MPEKETSLENKRGRLSHEEMDYIRKNVKLMGSEEVAKKLGRTKNIVENFARSEGIPYNDELLDDAEVAQAAISKELKESIEWEALRQEFTEQEMEYFGHRYAKLMLQFKEGEVLPTEETQIFQLIKFEILMQRNLKGAKRATTDIRRMENELTKLFSENENEEMSEEVRNLALNIENQLLAARSAQNSKSAEFVKLQEKHSSLLKELKATRDQRISRVESSSKNILALIKNMQQKKFRLQEGRQQALVNLAVEKEKNRLSEYHNYGDNTVDRPLLTPETAKLD
jgi:hypothetical protein